MLFRSGAVFLCRHGSDYLLFPQADEGRLPASALRIVAGAVAEWRNGDVPVPDYAFAIVRMGTASFRCAVGTDNLCCGVLRVPYV